MKSILLSGPAGTGKTSLAEHYANIHNADLIYYLCHEWSTAEDFLFSVSIPAVAKAMSGEKQENFYQEGILARALRLSRIKNVVLLIDEIDKASSRIDALLLDFLQNVRIPKPEGGFLFGNPDNIRVFVTSNEQREIIPPLNRRLFKVRLKPLPADVEAKLLAEPSSYFYLDAERDFIIRYMDFTPTVYENYRLQKFIARVGSYLRSRGLDISLYELKQLYLNIPMCKNKEDLAILTYGWLVRNEEYEEKIIERFKTFSNLVNAIWDLSR